MSCWVASTTWASSTTRFSGAGFALTDFLFCAQSPLYVPGKQQMQYKPCHKQPGHMRKIHATINSGATLEAYTKRLQCLLLQREGRMPTRAHFMDRWRSSGQRLKI